MGKAILFVVGCAAWTLSVVVLTLFFGNSGWRGIESQSFVAPSVWWTTPIFGAIEGMILAMGNLLGPWPRLAWRKIAFAYALFAASPFLAVVAYVMWNRWIMSGDLSIVSVGTYMYLDPNPGAAGLMLFLTSVMGAVVVFFRIRKHRKATRAAQVL